MKRAGAGEGARIAEKIEGAKTYTVSITILLRKSDFRRRGLPRSVSGVGVFQNLILEANAFTTPRFIMCFGNRIAKTLFWVAIAFTTLRFIICF